MEHSTPADSPATDRLWQVQVMGSAKNSFTYQLLPNAKEALASHQDPKLQDLKALEEIQKVRLISGGPPLEGHIDQDGVGIQRWQTVIYAAGEDPSRALDFISLVLEFKLQRGILAVMPKLVVAFPNGGFQGPLRGPWDLTAMASNSDAPKPFAALPPRGRRHVLAQLEIKEDSEGKKYLFTLFGNLYPFRGRLEELQVSAAEVDLGAEGGAQYIRYLEFADLDEGEALLNRVLEHGLLRLPIYFIDATNAVDDEVAAWILEQPGVFLGEK